MLKELVVRWDPYTNDDTDMSVTDVNRGTKEIILNKRYRSWLKAQPLTNVEANSGIHASLGRAWDAYIETIVADNPDFVGHTRLYFPVTYNGTRRIISGEIDLYHKPTGTIIDAKLVSMGKLGRLQVDSSEYANQLNGYAWLMTDGYLDKACTVKCTWPVNKLSLFVSARDWEFHSTRDSSDEIQVPLRPIEETRKQFLRKMKDILDNLNAPDEDIPYCSAEDRYEHAPTYPVFKKNADGSFKEKPTAMPGTANFGSEIQAKQYIDNHKEKDKLYWVKRGGEPMRCMFYCRYSNRKCDYLTQRRVVI